MNWESDPILILMKYNVGPSDITHWGDNSEEHTSLCATGRADLKASTDVFCWIPSGRLLQSWTVPW